MMSEANQEAASPISQAPSVPARPRSPLAWPVAKASEIPPGERLIVIVKERSIGVFNVNGEYVAVLNICPHELAPVCRGRVGGTTLPSPPGEYRWGREGEIVACPWHGWEFDLLTGTMLADGRIRLKRYPVDVRTGTMLADGRIRLKQYPVDVRDGTVYVTL